MKVTKMDRFEGRVSRALARLSSWILTGCNDRSARCGKLPALQVAVALLLGVCATAPAAASCAFASGNTTGTATLTLPATIAVPRDAPMGRVLYDSGAITAGPSSVNCTGGGTMTNGYATAMTPVAGYADVYQSGVAGIGVKVAFANYMGAPDMNIQAIGWPATSNSLPSGSKNYGPMGRYDVQLILVGPVTPGRTTLPSALARIVYAGLTVSQLQSAGNTTITVISCTTPDVTVPMGTYKAAAFSGKGSTSSPVGFNLSLNNCPAGMTSIQYQLSAPGGVIDAANGVVALSSDSTAQGIGLKVMNSAGTAMNYNTQYPMTSYVSATGGSYTIPLKAAYYQTGTTVSPGSANALLTFTMTYQ